VTVLLLAVLALPGGLASALLAHRRRPSFAVGLATAVACVLASASIYAGDTVPLAGTVLGGSDGLRTLALAWSIATLLFGIIDGLLGDGPSILGPALVGLGAGAVGLSVSDAGVGFAILTAGAMVSAVVPVIAIRGAGRDGASLLGMGSFRPVLAAGLIGLVVVAWGASPAGPFSAAGPLGAADPALDTAMGLAVLALATAVAIRLGAIPAHVWAARFAEAMPASAVPPLLGWGSAAFVLVALGWVDLTISTTGASLDLERAIVTVVAAVSIVLAGIAAILHDDIEHVLAYSIVQDAGVALLAFATFTTTGTDAGRDWIVGAVAVKSGLAAWVLVARETFEAHRRADLGGWARKAPLLGVAFGLIIIAAIGLPGMALFEARAELIKLTIPDPVGVVVLVSAFAPLVYLGRLLVSGLGAMSGAVASARRADAHLRSGVTGGWEADRSPLRIVPSAIRANRYPLAAVASVLIAVVGLTVAIGGLGSTRILG
jgi:multicomponent Na+:H+ antiporter subunit D